MPQAILTKDVDSLGEAGAVVDVSAGYLRNYLIPRQLAQPATQASVDEVRRRQDAQEKARKQLADRAQETSELLSKTVLTISHQAGEDGRLFGSVTTKEIAQAIEQARDLKIEKKRIMLEEPIKEIGTYKVDVEISQGVIASLKTIVVQEK